MPTVSDAKPPATHPMTLPMMFSPNSAPKPWPIAVPTAICSTGLVSTESTTTLSASLDGVPLRTSAATLLIKVPTAGFANNESTTASVTVPATALSDPRPESAREGSLSAEVIRAPVAALMACRS